MMQDQPWPNILLELITCLCVFPPGTIQVDAHNVVLTLCEFSYVALPFGIATAATIRVGNMLGAGNHASARRSGQALATTPHQTKRFLLVRVCIVWIKYGSAISLRINFLSAVSSQCMSPEIATCKNSKHK